MRNPWEDDFYEERGRPAKCYACDEEAVAELMVQGHQGPVALCGGCLDDAVICCPGCDQNFWQKDGTRIYASANKYCPRCTKEHPVVAKDLAQAHRLDEHRDDVNGVRR